jgi:ArsR family transcriptional regulator, arsenate/arsenite/antimonite-responsive transcriptional repressor
MHFATIRVMKLLDLPVRTRGVCCDLPKAISDSKAQRLAEALRVLADPARLQILDILRQVETPVCNCDFPDRLNLSQPTVSHHMGKLKDAGLIEVTKKGIWSFYRLRPGTQVRVQALLDAVS